MNPCYDITDILRQRRPELLCFTMCRCPDVYPVLTWTRPQGGRVHYTHAVAEASYDGAQLSSMLIDID